MEAGATALGLTVSAPLGGPTESKGEGDRATTLSDGGISRSAIPVKLVWQPLADGTVRLAWDMEIDQLDGRHWWSARVDAATGDLLDKVDWVASDMWTVGNPAYNRGAASAAPQPTLETVGVPNAPLSPDDYRVYAVPVESPNHGSRSLVTNPADALASPFGWHDTNGAAGAEFTTTQGNNVHAYTDTDANNTPDAGSSPDGGPTLVFDFPIDLTQPPSAYRPAAVTNLFYWNNLAHDLNYRYGFTEAATNFQTNNYGRGGTGNDSVQAEAQDGSGTDNANFATPSEGSRPRMQMYLWSAPTPDKDGDLDNGIILHEYGHGISNRLVAGSSSVNCLSNAEQMGEGWSDWQSLIFTARASDTSTQRRGVGTYALDQPTNGNGIREFPYTTDMTINTHTYNRTQTAAVPHGVGSVWTAMLWEMYWGLVNQYGFDPNFYTGTGGNNIAMNLVNEGLKLTPCNPGFVSGRDAILAADQAIYSGANRCTIWQAFAKRGLGENASQGSSNSNADNVQGFNIPTNCSFGTVDDTEAICQGTPAVYTLSVGALVGAPATLSLTGNPAGTTASFSPNPVTTIPGNSTLTIGNTAAAASGNYTMTATATGTSQTLTETLYLAVSAPLAAAPTLASPANNTANANTTPTLTWNAVAGATSYTVEIASDAAFTTIVQSATTAGTSYTTSPALTVGQMYYWRVRASNSCGFSANSTAFRFLVSLQAGNLCVNPNIAIPDSPSPGITSTLSSAVSLNITDLDVAITTTHTWVGDLIFTLRHVDTNTSVIVIDRPGRTTTGSGCSNNNLRAVLSDEAAAPVETQCTASPPAPYAIDGTFSPNNPLSAFDGQNLSGTWQLRVEDEAGVDTGTLIAWCLQAAAPTSADYTDSPDSFGFAWHTGTGTLRLGSGWSSDTLLTVNGDNASDDGVTIVTTSNWSPGANATGTANITGGSGYLAGWFDWNNDGDFADAGEKEVGQNVVAGVNALAFQIPPTAITNVAVEARFRLYTAEPTAVETPFGTETVTGGVAGGEVEDYVLTNPLAVQLAAFEARHTEGGVLATWETASETSNAGFNLLRATSATATPVQINTELIPSQAPGGGGASYSYVDATADPNTTYFYWLDAVGTDGSTTRFGPVSAEPSTPTAIDGARLTTNRPSVGLLAPTLLLGLTVAMLIWHRRR